jgi:hypothetical protein
MNWNHFCRAIGCCSYFPRGGRLDEGRDVERVVSFRGEGESAPRPVRDPEAKIERLRKKHIKQLIFNYMKEVKMRLQSTINNRMWHYRYEDQAKVESLVWISPDFEFLHINIIEKSAYFTML